MPRPVGRARSSMGGIVVERIAVRHRTIWPRIGARCLICGQAVRGVPYDRADTVWSGWRTNGPMKARTRGRIVAPPAAWSGWRTNGRRMRPRCADSAGPMVATVALDLAASSHPPERTGRRSSARQTHKPLGLVRDSDRTSEAQVRVVRCNQPATPPTPEALRFTKTPDDENGRRPAGYNHATNAMRID